ncbi:MAG: hypothetical protein ILP08_01635 [Lachnospiraceae bacterium]|nr:hypothetical protein [Lachnospiraceae bacterium]
MERNLFEMMRSHPRPQMYRSEYVIINDGWTLNNRDIKLPYPPESSLSGYEGPDESVLFYEKHFDLPKEWIDDMEDKRVLLHIGAADQIARIYMNGTFLGEHIGGYLPFSLDITSVVKNSDNVLKVDVTDRNIHLIPYGKQSKNPAGMWYTGISGIWKTVWLERVPNDYVKRIKLTPDLNGCTFELFKNEGSEKEGFSVEITGLSKYGTKSEVFEDRKYVFSGTKAYVAFSDPKLWTIEEPWLYSAKIRSGEDEFLTYFALRTVSIQEVRGLPRVMLNNEPVFLNGVLDQGYFDDGIYVPERFSYYDRDIKNMKALGFNMLRKHLKVEPEYFYAACDRLGMLVMQDMVQNGNYNFFLDTLLPYFQGGRRPDKGVLGLGADRKTERTRRYIFAQHTKKTVVELFNHPSIIAWTVFNEGWGQFESDRFYEGIRRIDRTRLIDTTSGWYRQKKSDFDSRHQYFRNRQLVPEMGKPLLISECGGYGYDVTGDYAEINLRQYRSERIAENMKKFEEKIHKMGENVDKAIDLMKLPDRKIEAVEMMDLIRKNRREKYGQTFQYGAGCGDEDELTDRIIRMYKEMVFPALEKGLCGIVYTQLSDVEGELNGLYTYDRTVLKVDGDRMRKNAARLYETYYTLTENEK